jgi:hypothetical protein
MREGIVMCALAVVGCSAARAEQGVASQIDTKADEPLRKMSIELARVLP